MRNFSLVACFVLGVAAGYFIASAFHVKPYGAALPQTAAVFETSLASPISSSATTMTLTANSIRGGGSLSGFNCFTIDEGSAQAETICGTVSGTSVSSLTRGISQATGTTTVAALQFSHRRGANVKITDFPVIQILKAQNNGEDTFPNPLVYANGQHPCISTSASTTICDKDYSDNLVNQGAATATESVAGISRLATALQQASSTDLGSDIPLALQAKYATDTPTYGCAVGYTGVAGAGCTLIAQLTGKIKQSWLDLTASFSVSGLWTFSGGLTSTATTTLTGSDVHSNAVVINGASTQWPSANSVGLLKNDGNGVLSYGGPVRYSTVSTSPDQAGSAGYATTTLLTFPSGTLVASSTIEINHSGSVSNCNGGAGTFYLRDASGNTFISFPVGGCSSSSHNSASSIHGIISFNTSSSESTQYDGVIVDNSVPSIANGSGTASVSASALTALYGVIQSVSSNGASTDNLSVVINP